MLLGGAELSLEDDAPGRGGATTAARYMKMMTLLPCLYNQSHGADSIILFLLYTTLLLAHA